MRRAAVAAALLGTLLAGCGGASGPPRLAQAEYVRRGEAVCRDYRAGLRALKTPTQVSQFGGYIAQALPLLERAVARLGRLRPPSALERPFADYLAALRASRRRAVDLRAAAQRADGRAVEALLGTAARTRGRSDGLARRAGLAACAGV